MRREPIPSCRRPELTNQTATGSTGFGVSPSRLLTSSATKASKDAFASAVRQHCGFPHANPSRMLDGIVASHRQTRGSARRSGIGPGNDRLDKLRSRGSQLTSQRLDVLIV